MAGNADKDLPRRWSRWRLAGWGAAAGFLLMPLIAMQFTDEVDWDLADFVVAGALVFGAGASYELAVRRTRNRAYRAAVGVALAAAFLLVWANLAVGIIGSEDNPANLMYHGVLAVGIVGAILARFRPRGMARALVATALAQVVVAAVALVAGLGFTGPVTLFFAALWLTSAWLFRKAARSPTSAGAAP
jgi:hypothetical protein